MDEGRRAGEANNIRRFCKERGMTQRALADALGTSAAQVSRWADGQGIGYDTAVSMAGILGVTPAQLFPGLGAVMLRQQAKAANPREIGAAMRAVGIDVEAPPTQWHLCITLRGGELPIRYRVDHEVAEQVSAVLVGASRPRFATFVTCDGLTVTVNAAEVDLCRARWSQPDLSRALGVEPPAVAVAPEPDADERPMRVFFAGRAEAGEFLVAEGIHEVVKELETFVGDASFVSILDEDGDRVMMRAGGLALIEVPDWIMDHSKAADEDQRLPRYA